MAAVFKFKASVNLVGRSKGSSPAFAPCRILPSNAACLSPELGEIWSVREQTAGPNDEVTFVHEWDAVLRGKFDNAFAVQSGQAIDHHKPGIRLFPIHCCEGFGKVFRLALEAVVR